MALPQKSNAATSICRRAAAYRLVAAFVETEEVAGARKRNARICARRFGWAAGCRIARGSLHEGSRPRRPRRLELQGDVGRVVATEERGELGAARRCWLQRCEAPHRRRKLVLTLCRHRCSSSACIHLFFSQKVAEVGGVLAALLGRRCGCLTCTACRGPTSASAARMGVSSRRAIGVGGPQALVPALLLLLGAVAPAQLLQFVGMLPARLCSRARQPVCRNLVCSH